MEGTYRHSATARHYAKQKTVISKGDQRRLVQLLISLGLFLIVFFGRGAFSSENSIWRDLIMTDTDFKAAFQNLGSDLSDKNTNIWTALVNFTAASFGVDAPEKQEPTDSVIHEKIEPLPAITKLSETRKFGLNNMSEYGIGKYFASEKNEITSESVPEVTITEEPEIVTAVAQPYNDAGEKLPRNVSHEFYELGLENTVTPVMGQTTSFFGYRSSPTSGKREFHLALDIAAEKGTEIGSFADGVVRYIGESDEFGQYLMIDHDNGVATFYAHCSKLLVRKGDIVSCGQTVALVGDTGNATGHHLHFTIEKDDIRLDPAYYVDPSAAI